MLYSSPFWYLPLLVLTIGTCIGGNDDAQKEAQLNVAKARSEVTRRTPGGRDEGRRRHTDLQMPHSASNTMSRSLYDHFRPLDPELPSGDLLPFLQFGMKLPASPSKVRSQGLSTTAASPSTAFPSTNALVQEENDNEMTTLEEESPSRTQVQASRAKLKAAIMLQMVVNSAKRKKLVQREQLRSKASSKEVLKEGEVKEWGMKVDGEEESLIATNSRRRLVIDGKKLNDDEGEGESEEDSGEISASLPNESEEIILNDAPDEGTFTIPPEIEAKEWKVAPAPKLSTEEQLIAESTEIATSPTSPVNQSKDDSISVTPNIRTTVNIELTTSNNSRVDTDVDGDNATSSASPTLPPLTLPVTPSTTSPTSSLNLSTSFLPTPQTYVSNSSSIPTSPSTRASTSSPVPRSLSPVPSTSTSIPFSFPDSTINSTEPYSQKSSSIDLITSTPLTSSSSSPSTTDSESTVSVSTVSVPTQSTTPTITSTSTMIATSPSTNLPVNESLAATQVTSTSTKKAPVTSTTAATTTTTTKNITSLIPSVLLSSRAPISPFFQRYPTKIHPPQYPTLISNHPVQTSPSFNNTHRKPNRQPNMHRDNRRPPHLIFVPPSLRPSISRRPSFPSPPSTPAKMKPQVPTLDPSSSLKPIEELPVKAELDARDWIAVPPPNTTSSPSVSSTVISPPTHPILAKPHPNKVQKGWQRPYHPPHSLPPFIPVEGHISLPWQPATSSVKTTSQSTPVTTTGREVLSVVTSVSVESATTVHPSSSTILAATEPQTVSITGNGSDDLKESFSTERSMDEIGLENYPSQYPHHVSIFAKDSVDSGNTIGEGEDQVTENDPEVIAEPGMASTTTYILLSLAVVPGVVAVASAARCFLLHRKKSLYESETSSDVSCMGGRTLKSCSSNSQGHGMDVEESCNVRPSSDMFRVITQLPRVAYLGWEHEQRREKGGRNADKGILQVEEEQEKQDEPSSRDSIENWEFPRSKLRLQTLLGQGNFGQVWKAEADGICDSEVSTRLVAVKLVKVRDGDEKEDIASIENNLCSPCSDTQSPLTRRHGELLSPLEQCRRKRREEFMSELSIMQLLSPPHPNVVTLLGCCTTTEPPLLIMEYVMFGKLLTFLREHKTKKRFTNISDDPEILTSRDLLVFAYCVIKGMEYLVSKGVVHRDLAARNILVDHNKTCKIADFGMSRCVANTGGQIYEGKQKQGALPVRWMAPESLFRGIFTHKSDVWGFGVLLWEIMTLGATPYPGIGAREVMRRVRDGRRLERPSHVRVEIFRVAARCWHRDPGLRPTFSRLRADMGPILASSTAGSSPCSGGIESDMCLVSKRGNRRWRPPGPQIDLNQFEDESG